MALFMHVRAPKIYKPRKTSATSIYRSVYRFHEDQVTFLTNVFLDDRGETRGGALSPKHKMEVFLRYVGDPGFQVGVGEDKGIHQSTVSRTVTEVVEQIVAKSAEWIQFPINRREIEEAKRVWQQKYNFPCAVGALDCTHIAIMKPSIQGDEYINRKNIATLNVQATCNSTECFTSVDAQWPGSVHDSRILRRSGIPEILQRYRGEAVLIADAGYALTPWLMTPFKNPRNDMERNYNRVHAENRVIIERLFGQLKRRFPILSSKIRIALEKIPTLIVSCFVLHNVSKFLKDEDDLETIYVEIHEANEDQDQDNFDDIRQEGRRKREVIAQLLYN